MERGGAGQRPADDQHRDVLESALLPLFPWQSGEKNNFVRVVPSVVTGRRFVVPASARRGPGSAIAAGSGSSSTLLGWPTVAAGVDKPEVQRVSSAPVRCARLIAGDKTAERPVRGHDLLAQRREGHRNQLQIRNRQRDADDGDGRAMAVSTCPIAIQMPATTNQMMLPSVDNGVGASASVHHHAPERPQRVARDPERRDAEWDGNDQQAAHNAGQEVSQGQTRCRRRAAR